MKYDLNTCRDFYQGKRVLVTGHTGFKGSWLCRILTLAGAQVTRLCGRGTDRPGPVFDCRVGGYHGQCDRRYPGFGASERGL